MKLLYSSPLTITDIAWAAGVLEGEGCFSWYKKKTLRQQTFQIVASQVNEEPLLNMKKLFGGHIWRSFAPSRSNPIYLWRTTGARARGIMMTVYAFMSDRRKAKIREILQHPWQRHGKNIIPQDRHPFPIPSGLTFAGHRHSEATKQKMSNSHRNRTTMA